MRKSIGIMSDFKIFFLAVYHLNRKKDELNEQVKFRDGVKWIRVEEYGSYLYKESYDESVPFKKVDIIKNKRGGVPNISHIERHNGKYGTISKEKLNDLSKLVEFVKREYRYFYEQLF